MPFRLRASCSRAAGVALGAHGCARANRHARPAADGAVRDRRRSADARSALRARRRDRRRAAGRAAGLRALHRHRRARPYVSCPARPHPDPRQRRHFARRPHDRLPSAARTRAGGRRRRDRARRGLDAARDPRRPQSGALARGLRSRRAVPKRSTRTRFGSCSSDRGHRPLRRSSVTEPRRSTCCPRICSNASAISRRARSARIRSATDRTGSCRGRAATGSSTSEPAYWRGAPARRADRVRMVPDPGTNFTAVAQRRLDWNLLSPAQRAALGAPARSAFRTVPLALVAGIALNTQHPPLDDVRVRRAIAASIDRGAISREAHLRTLSGRRHGAAARSWARDPSVHEPATIRPRRTGCSTRPDGGAAPAACARRTANALALTYVQFPESQTGVRVAAFVQSELAARGVARRRSSRSRTRSSSCPKAQGGTLATGAFDLAYVPWPMGADPDDSSLLTATAARTSCAGAIRRVDALERRALVAPSRAERAALRRDRAPRRGCGADRVPLQPVVLVRIPDDAARLLPNAFNPTWNAADWN